jgi:WD40 repeat protein
MGNTHLLQRGSSRSDPSKVPTLNTITFDVSTTKTHLLKEHELLVSDSLRPFISQYSLSLPSFVLLASIPNLHKCGKEERHWIERRLLYQIIQNHQEVLRILNIQPQDAENLAWHPNGKPYFSNNNNVFISFSHCHDTLVVTLSSHSIIACDLEILRPYNKTVNDWTELLFPNNNITQLLQMLCRHGTLSFCISCLLFLHHSQYKFCWLWHVLF